MANYFVRELELNNCSLEIYQQLEGDVGCVVWDAAITLAKYIDLQQSKGQMQWKGMNVIELGAGTGIVGLAAATLGANVTITDLPEFIPLMEKNISLNTKSFKEAKITAKKLKWGEDLENFTSTYDVILMADLIYYKESIEPLIQTMVGLSSKGTKILMSHEERTTGNKQELERQFFELAKEHFEIKKILLEEQDSVYSSEDIYIHEMERKCK
ncbi:protein N-lysine methyltransferase METTL21D-like isoform X2 [Rhopilema esculentum]|uniref:protein N-lysine methyltransferase METTL21D-like isoform X2 n=1 Tax=Rhopilema esculentum TaxID=499914 RepID=UPI0031DD7214|eukprot:gene8528-14529_t